MCSVVSPSQMVFVIDVKKSNNSELVFFTYSFILSQLWLSVNLISADLLISKLFMIMLTSLNVVSALGWLSWCSFFQVWTTDLLDWIYLVPNIRLSRYLHPLDIVQCHISCAHTCASCKHQGEVSAGVRATSWDENCTVDSPIAHASLTFTVFISVYWTS